MKSDQTILEEAKEKVAKEQGYESWRDYVEHCGHEVVSYEKADPLALELKVIEMSKWYDGIASKNNEEREQLKAELSQAKEENIQWSEKVEKLDSELITTRRSISQEKAKAFDEGVNSAINTLGFSSAVYIYPQDYTIMSNWMKQTTNPYTPKDLTLKK